MGQHEQPNERVNGTRRKHAVLKIALSLLCAFATGLGVAIITFFVVFWLSLFFDGIGEFAGLSAYGNALKVSSIVGALAFAVVIVATWFFHRSARTQSLHNGG